MTFRPCRLLAALIGLACAAPGCEMLGGGSGGTSDRTPSRRDRDRDYDRARDADRYGDDDVIGRDRGTDYDAEKDAGRDTGYGRDRRGTTRGLDSIPRRAERVADGGSEMFDYIATNDGTVYVYDADDDRVVFTEKLSQGERFVVNPELGRVSVAGTAVPLSDLSTRHRYRIYFDEQ